MIAGVEFGLREHSGLGREAIAELQEGAVGVIGLGVLGGQTSFHLGSLGIPQVLIDCDVVEERNLANQMFPATSLGQAKPEVRAQQIQALNPGCPVHPITARVEDVGLGIFAGMRALVTGLDSRFARLRVAEVASRLGLVWLDAAVDGSGRSLRGTVSVFDGRQQESACYACRFAQSDLDAIAREARGPGCPSWRRPGQPVSPPTLQSAAFGGVIAGLLAVVATRVLLGRANELLGRQLVVECSGLPRTTVLALPRNPRCLLGHQRLAPLHVVCGDRVDDLLAVAEQDLGSVEWLQLHGRRLVQGLACVRCAARHDVTRVPEACSDADLRCSCGAELHPGVITNTLGVDEARRIGPRTWAELGMPMADVVTAAGNAGEAHYIVNTAAARAS